MRIDKYIWAVRAFKTRSLAAEACKLNRVFLEGTSVKPSKDIKIGDDISIKKGAVTYAVKVIAIPKNRVGAKLVAEYAKDITSAEELEKAEMIRLSKAFEREKGIGRPTKKERRDIDRLKL